MEKIEVYHGYFENIKQYVSIMLTETNKSQATQARTQGLKMIKKIKESLSRDQKSEFLNAEIAQTILDIAKNWEEGLTEEKPIVLEFLNEYNVSSEVKSRILGYSIQQSKNPLVK